MNLKQSFPTKTSTLRIALLILTVSLNLEGNSQGLFLRLGNDTISADRIPTSGTFFLSFDSLSKRRDTVPVNDSLVTISKKTAQNILKAKDSADRLRKAYTALQLNYNRLKQKSSIQDTAYSYKDKEVKLCRGLLQNQQSQTDMWSIKSHNQEKEIKKQRFMKWIFIVISISGIAWAAAK